MTINIEELRRLAQEASPGPWYIGSGTYEGRNIYSVEAITDDEGFTYNPVVATAEDDGNVCWEANAHLIAAANPAAVSELLDRLEEAENAWKISDKTVYDLTEKVIPNIQKKLEAAEKELVEIRHGAAVANDTIKALQAKIEQMEKQEPIGTALLCTRCSTPFDGDHYCPACGFHTAMEEHVYALPGAKGEEK